MDERGVAFLHDSDVDAIGSAFEHPLVDHLPCLQVLPYPVNICSREVGCLVLGRCRCLCSRPSCLTPAVCHSPYAEKRGRTDHPKEKCAHFRSFSIPQKFDPGFPYKT